MCEYTYTNSDVEDQWNSFFIYVKDKDGHKSAHGAICLISGLKAELFAAFALGLFELAVVLFDRCLVLCGLRVFLLLVLRR